MGAFYRLFIDLTMAYDSWEKDCGIFSLNLDSYLEWSEIKRCFYVTAFQFFFIDYDIKKVWENQEVMELNGAHQRLVYADNVLNLLG